MQLLGIEAHKSLTNLRSPDVVGVIGESSPTVELSKLFDSAMHTGPTPHRAGAR